MDPVKGETSPAEKQKSRKDRAPHHCDFGREYNPSFWDSPSKANLFNSGFGLVFLVLRVSIFAKLARIANENDLFGSLDQIRKNFGTFPFLTSERLPFYFHFLLPRPVLGKFKRLPLDKIAIF